MDEQQIFVQVKFSKFFLSHFFLVITFLSTSRLLQQSLILQTDGYKPLANTVLSESKAYIMRNRKTFAISTTPVADVAREIIILLLHDIAIEKCVSILHLLSLIYIYK